MQIKLRVLDKQTTTIHQYGATVADSFFTTPDGELYYFNEDTKERSLVGERYKLLSFTGLIDHMFNDIYEGDIIRFRYTTDTDDVDHVAAVCWYGDSDWGYPAFDFDGNHLKQHHFDSNSLQTITQSDCYCEVIGNIYQHEHLLP